MCALLLPLHKSRQRHGRWLPFIEVLLVSFFLHTSAQSGAEDAACLGELFEAMGFMAEEVPVGRDCLGLARSRAQEPEFIAALQPQSRLLPPAEPALSAWEWDRRVRALRPRRWPQLPKQQCPFDPNAEVTRIKIYNNVIYMHYPHHDQSFPARHAWKGTRAAALEQILLVMWLYKDIPDMDLALNIHDNPLACKVPFPVLQSSVFNLTSPTSGTILDVDPHTWPCRGPTAKAQPCPGYTKGYTIPTADAMKGLAMSPKQLWWYAYCVHARYVQTLGGMYPVNACQLPRKSLAFWRGSATGLMSGWSDVQEDQWEPVFQSSKEASFLFGVLQTKRVALTLMANKWPWMDAGLTGITEPWYHGWYNHKENEFIAAVLRAITFKQPLDIEQWNRYHLALNLDGAGPAYRLPRLMLGNVPVVKVESILREWFIEHALPGIHYVPVRHDLSDIGETTRTLLAEAEQDSSMLERIAVAAAKLAVERANLLAQLESVAWSLARIKEACRWKVRPPEGAVSLRPEHAGGPRSRSGKWMEPGWHVVKLSRRQDRYAKLPPQAQQSFMAVMHHNFETD